MEQYLGTLADMRRRELTTDARQSRAADRTRRAEKTLDPLRGLPRARMMWWIAADRLRRAAIQTTTFEMARGAQ